MTRYLVPALVLAAAVGFVLSLWMIFVDTPIEVSYLPDGSVSGSSLYFNYKIFFYHVSHAFWLFGAVVLLTGSIWAKAAWDHWWVWENRLTMSLLLWLTLVGYVIVRRFAGASGERLAAAMAIFAMVGVPFIYTMVNKDDSHPQAGAGGNVATLDPRMRPAFWLSVAVFFLWFLALVITRVQQARAERQLRELREQGLDAGIFS